MLPAGAGEDGGNSGRIRSTESNGQFAQHPRPYPALDFDGTLKTELPLRLTEPEPVMQGYEVKRLVKKVD